MGYHMREWGILFRDFSNRIYIIHGILDGDLIRDSMGLGFFTVRKGEDLPWEALPQLPQLGIFLTYHFSMVITEWVVFYYL